MTSSHLVPTSSDEVTNRSLVHLVPRPLLKGRGRGRGRGVGGDTAEPTPHRDEVTDRSCPTCGATPGEPCRRLDGTVMPTLTHPSRSPRRRPRR